MADEAYDHDRARAALERGEVMPLRAILDRVERDYPGKVVEVELEREHERWIYEIKVLQSGGALRKLEVDGRDGTVLGVKGRDRKREGSEGGKR
ncbi:hypothetical protein GPA25_10920 [Aromatoleum diolicum]|uniref:PepSY domain-containing protein n=2 Tax=Aromatoleum diolicum TaxID=75796 RepID=A0ABX1QBB4_9RHOO|nr:PepSY domain-containing protein [Aromatoleum diolicum]NMG75268.1 hypothetical protein [Aromatoleum diolicum]